MLITRSPGHGPKPALRVTAHELEVLVELLLQGLARAFELRVPKVGGRGAGFGEREGGTKSSTFIDPVEFLYALMFKQEHIYVNSGLK